MRTSETGHDRPIAVGETPTGTPRVADYGIAPPGYRLPAATRLGRVRLEVADLVRSTAYYEEIIGLRVLDRAGSQVTLAPSGDVNPLVELYERRGARAVPRHGRLGLYHFAILLPDRAALGRYLAHLAEREVYAGMSDHLVSEAIYLTDPDGLGIEVYSDRPRSLWRHENRQLVMATEPLDARSVVASAAGERWAGAPRGTVLGHVHLHVGDIAPAAEFYHAGLGFDKTVWNYPGALFLSAGGYHHHLGTNTWAARAPRAEEGDARLLDWEIVLPRDDVEAAGESLERAGYPLERTGGDVLARDPWGTALRLVSHP